MAWGQPSGSSLTCHLLLPDRPRLRLRTRHVCCVPEGWPSVGGLHQAGRAVPARGSGGNRLTRAPSAAGAGSDPVLLGSHLGPNCREATPLGDAAAFAAAPACALPAAARSLGASPAQRRPPFTSSALLLGQRGPLTPPTFPANSVRLC